MAIGLSRKANLSEKNLNLSEAIQKLYAPGVQDDLGLFSLSSQIKSFINSGPESDLSSQIIGIRSEKFLSFTGEPVDRTKFLTKDVTYSTGDKVYFDTFTLPIVSSERAYNPKYSINGSIPEARIITQGEGYYFEKVGVTPQVQEFLTNKVIDNVVLRGRISQSDSAKARVTFSIDSTTQFDLSDVEKWAFSDNETTTYVADGTPIPVFGTTNTLAINNNGTWQYLSPDTQTLTRDVSIKIFFVNGQTSTIVPVIVASSGLDQTGQITLPPIDAPSYLTDFTGFYTFRFIVSNIEITDGGSDYVIGEELELVEGVVTDQETGAPFVLKRQKGERYFTKEATIVSEFYFYDVLGASNSGYYLFDSKFNKYLFLDNNKGPEELSSEDPREIRVIRSDAISIDNILQLKYLQSPIAIRSYSIFRLEGSIVGSISNLSRLVNRLRDDSYLLIQNTKKPTSITSEENNLGFEYNKITGKNLTFYQRLVIRDQDYALGANDITGLRLKNNVDNFTLIGQSEYTIQSYTINADTNVFNAGDTVNPVLGNDAKTLIVNSTGTWTYESADSSNILDGVVITMTFEGGFEYKIQLLTQAETANNASGTIPLPKVRIPGIFLKVGDSYRRAYSTTDKAYSQKTEDGTGYLNPNIDGTSPDLSLSAASIVPGQSDFYTYNTIISKFAQRVNVNGVDGAFYFQKVTPPVVSPVTDIKGITYYSIPLFKFVG
jgi:hypothetical protein